MDKMKCTRKVFPLLISSLFLASCGNQSNTTGWEYNQSDNGGFFVNTNYEGQRTGPGLVFVEGGTFTMGETSEDFYKEWDNVPRQVSVSSFYIDENEVTNTDYREYLFWLRRVYDIAYYPEILNSALPDTLVWRDELSYNEQMVRNYFRHPAYNFYPVVGVSWIQAMKYCSWRTDRVNEKILIDEGILNEFPDQQGVDHFDSEKYLYKSGEYTQQNKKGLKSYRPNSQYGDEGRPAKIEDGILLPTASPVKTNLPGTAAACAIPMKITGEKSWPTLNGDAATIWVPAAGLTTAPITPSKSNITPLTTLASMIWPAT
jgi:gliding motility-associated lipoprotein GldJ